MPATRGKRRATTRPYRVELIGGGVVSRRTYSTSAKALAAAQEDATVDSDLFLTAERQYVIMYRTPEGPWLPVDIVTVAGSGRVLDRRRPSHLRVVS